MLILDQANRSLLDAQGNSSTLIHSVLETRHKMFTQSIATILLVNSDPLNEEEAFKSKFVGYLRVLYQLVLYLLHSCHVALCLLHSSNIAVH